MKTKTKAPTLQEFRATEVIQFDDDSVFESEEGDDGRMMATVRIIKAGLSKNNRNYRVSALQRAAKEGIFDGVRMFRGHSKAGPLGRNFDELISAVESTEYDDKTQSLNGRVEFFDRPFYEKVNRAKRYMGVSIDSILRGTRTPDPRGGRALEDIHAFHQPRSVDWVIYPAAGGEILAMESEGDDNVIDWAAVEADAANLTEEDLKKNAPSLWKKFHPETTADKLPIHGHSAQEEEEDEEEDDPPKKGKKAVKKIFSQEAVEDIVTQRMTAYQKEQDDIAEKHRLAFEDVKKAFETSGLPPVTRGRLMKGFEGIEYQAYDEKKVKAVIDEAKEELKAAGAGPRITGMGAGDAPKGKDGEGGNSVRFAAMESVGAHFGLAKKPNGNADTGKKSDDPEEGK